MGDIDTIMRLAKQKDALRTECERLVGENITLRGMLASLVDCLTAYRADNHPVHWEGIDAAHDEAVEFFDKEAEKARRAAGQ